LRVTTVFLVTRVDKADTLLCEACKANLFAHSSVRFRQLFSLKHSRAFPFKTLRIHNNSFPYKVCNSWAETEKISKEFNRESISFLKKFNAASRHSEGQESCSLKVSLRSLVALFKVMSLSHYFQVKFYLLQNPLRFQN